MSLERLSGFAGNTLSRLVVAITCLLSATSALSRSNNGSVFVAWDPNPEPEVAGYRVHYGTESESYTSTVDVGLSTSVELPQLEPNRLHFCAVTAYDATGKESDYSEELPVVYSSSSTSPGASGGGIILINPDNGFVLGGGDPPEATGLGDGTFQVGFNAPAGTYHMWVRVRYPEAVSEALSVTVDSSAAGDLSLPDDPTSAASTSQPDLVWSRLISSVGVPTGTTIATGDHVLTISGLTTEFEIDRIVLSVSPLFVPSDSIPSSGDAVSIVTEPGPSIQGNEEESLIMSVEIVSTGPAEVQWFKDGYALLGENNLNIEFESLKKSSAGSYTALISSGQASVATSPTRLSIKPILFNVTRMSRNGNTRTLEIEGEIGETVTVWVSEDLVDWEVLTTVVNSTGTINFSDPQAAGENQRFYRLETP